MQLPYLIDGDVKLTQSNAILGYIARKIGIGKGALYPGPPLLLLSACVQP